MDETKSAYYVRGGVKCDFGDCFACEDDKCTLLKASYKDNEICPFYKPINREDVLKSADISTYKYAARRVVDLDAQIAEKERLIRSVNHTSSEVIKSIKKELAAIKIALKTVEKEKKKAAERIQKYEQREEEVV